MTAQGQKPSKILLIDDDPLVRQLSREYLESNGVPVVTAADGQEALVLFEDLHDDIAVVVLDLMMPKMNGRDCWRRLRELDPDVRVLVTTGCSLNADLDACLREGILGYLFKPYRPSQLLACLKNNM